MDKYNEELWKAAKRILRYLKGTKELKLTYKKNEENTILAFSDADWEGDKIDRKSTSGSVIFHGENLIPWASKKQSAVTLSTVESEYIAGAMCAAELLYIKGLTSELGPVKCSVVMIVDNQSAISMMCNYENTKRSKHIDIKVHFLKDIVYKKFIEVKYVQSELNVADCLTKTLFSDKFKVF